MIRPRKVTKGDPVEADHHNELVDAILERTPLSFAAGFMSTSPHGFHVRGQRGGRGGGDTTTLQPWDSFSLVGVGDPNPATGIYTSYKLKLWPGNVGGVVPGNMFTEFTVSATSYFVADCTCATGGVQSCNLVQQGSSPIPQAHALYAPPDSLKVLIGIFSEGTWFNIAQKNLSASPRETLRETDPDATPYGLPYRSYWNWRVE